MSRPDCCTCAPSARSTSARSCRSLARKSPNPRWGCHAVSCSSPDAQHWRVPAESPHHKQRHLRHWWRAANRYLATVPAVLPESRNRFFIRTPFPQLAGNFVCRMQQGNINIVDQVVNVLLSGPRQILREQLGALNALAPQVGQASYTQSDDEGQRETNSTIQQTNIRTPAPVCPVFCCTGCFGVHSCGSLAAFSHGGLHTCIHSTSGHHCLDARQVITSDRFRSITGPIESRLSSNCVFMFSRRHD